MFNIVLVEPEIPPNTGNIIRLCANSGCSLHLVHPLGFEMSEKQLRRAGLDYADMTRVSHYDSFDEFAKKNFEKQNTTDPIRFEHAVCFSTKGTKNYHEHRFSMGEWLLFGAETRGLDKAVLMQFPDQNVLRMPMIPSSRSLNLSNTVAIAVYEAWRQCDFAGA